MRFFKARHVSGLETIIPENVVEQLLQENKLVKVGDSYFMQSWEVFCD